MVLLCRGHNYPVWDVKASPFGHYFASAGADRTARLWSIERNQPLRVLAGDPFLSTADYTKATATSIPVFAQPCLPTVSFPTCHRNWRYTADDLSQYRDFEYITKSTSGPKLPRNMLLHPEWFPLVRSVRSECHWMAAGHYADVDVLGWHPNAHYLATGSSDHTIRLWDVRQGQVQRMLVGHRAAVSHRSRHLSFSAPRCQRHGCIPARFPWGSITRTCHER